MLDTWAEEELKTGTLSNGTVGTYLQAINRIKQHPVSRRKLKTVTSGHLQQFMDIMSFGGTIEDFVSKGYSKYYVKSFSAVLQQSFRFAVFPKQYITFNPMQYVVMRHKKDDMDENEQLVKFFTLKKASNPSSVLSDISTLTMQASLKRISSQIVKERIEGGANEKAALIF